MCAYFLTFSAFESELLSIRVLLNKDRLFKSYFFFRVDYCISRSQLSESADKY